MLDLANDFKVTILNTLKKLKKNLVRDILEKSIDSSLKSFDVRMPLNKM